MQDIYVDDFGKGFPLVLVHGFLGSSKLWDPQINFLKNNFRIIAPDLPGFGKSNNVKSSDNINQMAETVLKKLNSMKIDKFFLLGHSMGGMIVQEMAKISSEKILKLICYSTGCIGEMPERFETIEQSRERFKKIGHEKAAYSIAETWFVNGDKSKYFSLCFESGKQANNIAIDNALVAMKNYNGLKDLKNISANTLIIWGDKDRSYNFKQIEILNQNIQKSELKIFKGCAHNVHLERPEEFNRTILDYLKK